MASVINIVAISINRYWSIAYPISYRKYAKQHIVYLVMIFVWCFSFRKIYFIFLNKKNEIILVNFAPGIWLISLFDKSGENRKDCSGDYNRSFIYMLVAQFNYFIWPFIVLCILNLLIMLNIWRRNRKMTRLRSFCSSKSSHQTFDTSPKFPVKNNKRSSKKKSFQSEIINKENSILVINPFHSNPRQIFTEREKSPPNTPEVITYVTSVLEQYSPIIQSRRQTMKQLTFANTSMKS
jgi:hypothetical protein